MLIEVLGHLHSEVFIIKLCFSFTVTILKRNKSRQAEVSREAKKKQHACALLGLCDHYSELFTRMEALNI